ncbi:polysaccharide pyruvyl transferase family protein [Aeromonas veronii]|uniref:polysaccharide pyruvyl transferase family protein n=1 Tax=Aeromonas veronii TaxID=654 RepID=UPI0038E4296E
MRIGYLLFGDNKSLDHVGIIDRYGKSTAEVLRLTGANLGNLAFKYGAVKLLSDANTIVYITYDSDIEFVKKNVDLIVLPEANLVNPNVDYSRPAEFIKNVDKPCLLLGVGAQAIDLSSKVKCSPGTISFLMEVSKRTNNIIVRGSFTKNILSELGISNVEDLGCPSYMINSSNNLWKNIKEKSQAVSVFNNFAVTEGIYPQSARNDNIDGFERNIFQFVLSGCADYIGQVQTSVIANGLNDQASINRDDMYYLRKYLCGYYDESTFHSIASRRFKAFVRTDEWLNYYKSKQAVIGTRIHGNFLAIQSITPALPITHDSRTTELCQAMRIPYLPVEDAVNIKSNIDLIDAFSIVRNLDDVELDEHRALIAKSYIMNLKILGVEPSESLYKIAKITS